MEEVEPTQPVEVESGATVPTIPAFVPKVIAVLVVTEALVVDLATRVEVSAVALVKFT